MRKYVSIKGGQFLLNNGKGIEPTKLTKVSGKITKIYTKEEEYQGDKYNTIFLYLSPLEEGHDTLVLTVKLQSSPGKALACMLPNIDKSKEVVFNIAPDKEKEKKFNLFGSQDNKPVKWFYTAANPNGRPEVEVITLRSGKKQYDNTLQIEFYLNEINKLSESLGQTGNTNASTTNGTQATPNAAQSSSQPVPISQGNSKVGSRVPQVVQSDISEANDELPF